jgi:hypothetical protein
MKIVLGKQVVRAALGVCKRELGVKELQEIGGGLVKLDT